MSVNCCAAARNSTRHGALRARHCSWSALRIFRTTIWTWSAGSASPKDTNGVIHGHARVRVCIVQEGPTLLPTLDAHLHHPAPFIAAELLPTVAAVPLLCQLDAERRRKIMSGARSRKRRPILLSDLERRYKRVLDS